MPQGILPFQYASEKTSSNMTSYAGLGIYLDMAHAMKLGQAIDRHVGLRRGSQGYTDKQQVLSLILLNLSGGRSVSDLDVLETDEGLAKLVKHVEWTGLSKKERKGIEKRWRRESARTLPSQTACFDYLKLFHDEEQESLRQPGKAFIPSPSSGLQGLRKTNAELVEFYCRHSASSISTTTLDMDASILETNKRSALASYKTGPSYQPFSIYMAETGLVLHSEFRDGNVPAGYENLRVFKEGLAMLPPQVKRVLVRADTATYQWEFLRYCAEGKNERFGVIEFCIGADVTKEFRVAVAKVKDTEWKPLIKILKDGERVDTGQEWTELDYVPNASATKKNGPAYRFLAVRERLEEQLSLPGVVEKQLELPFQTMHMETLEGLRQYKIHGIVTNRDLPGGELIFWYRERCGKGEEINGVMKTDFTGGLMPSNKFGGERRTSSENAAWWAIMILSLNLDVAVRRLVLGGEWVSKRMKAVRFGLIRIAGRVVEQARRLVVKISGKSPSYGLLLKARERIAYMAVGPSG